MEQKKTSNISIRPATVEDAEKILQIYSYYVTDTAISFEYDVPTVEEFSGRIRNTLQKYPYLVAEEDGKIIGYTYAGVFKARAAYNHCVEITVYVQKDHKKSGIGKKLYAALTEALAKQGIKNIYACVAVCDVEDEYLTNNSLHFHEHMGFKVCGKFHRCGIKFGNEYDMVWLEKFIG